MKKIILVMSQYADFVVNYTFCLVLGQGLLKIVGYMIIYQYFSKRFGALRTECGVFSVFLYFLLIVCSCVRSLPMTICILCLLWRVDVVFHVEYISYIILRLVTHTQ